MKKRIKLPLLIHFTNVGCLKKILPGGLQFSDGTEKDEYEKYKWDDKNDAIALEKYKQKTSKNPYVLCFVPNTETLHHWKYYGNHVEENFSETDKIKCYIGYDRDKIEKYVNNHRDDYLPIRETIYAYVSDVQTQVRSLEDILYLKRKGFRVDEEARLVCLSKNTTKPILPKEVNSFIRKIVIAPDASKKDFYKIRSELINKFGISTHIISQSSLYYNEKWEKEINKVINNL